jgi:phosphohistidine phosphatase
VRVYLVQHAEYVPEEENPKKPLSKAGKESVEKMGKLLSEKLNLRLAQIFHSGKLRAQQTADIIASHLHPREVKADSDLSPLTDPDIWKEKLGSASDENTMVVGHLPHLSKLASSLLIGDENKELISFQMGSVVCLEQAEEGHWILKWMILPDILS